MVCFRFLLEALDEEQKGRREAIGGGIVRILEG